MERRTIIGAGAFALTLLALVCIPRHLPLSASPPPLVPANFHARLDQQVLTLRGSLPDGDTRDRLLDEAHNLYDNAAVRIIDQLTIDERIAPAAWLTALPSVLPILGQMNGRGSVMIDGHSLVLNGQVSSEQAKGTILRNVSPATATGLVLEDRVLTVRPTISPKALQAKLQNTLSRHRIDFESNQATLTPRGRAALDRIIPLLQQAPSSAIEIGGHTDSFGAPDYNQALSRRRAETVRQYFMTRGLTHRFTIVGYGASKPLTTQKNQAALRRNRRIELLVKGQDT